MTVCIAAACEDSTQLVLVSDSRVGFGDFSSDKGAVKYKTLSNDYVVLIAGNDVVYAGPTIARIETRLGSHDNRDPDSLALIAHEELAKTRMQVIEAKILKKYGITCADFSSKGKQIFTEQVFYDICNKISNMDLSLQLLLAGFDRAGRARLRIVQADDAPHDYDAIGFAAIGSGAPSAMAALSFAKDHSALSIHCNLWSAACHVFGAKFMSESATDVGKNTFFVSVGKKGAFYPHPFCGIEPVRKAWGKDAAPRLSREGVKILRDILTTGGITGVFNGSTVARCLKYCSPSFRKALKEFPQAAEISGEMTEDQVKKLLESRTIRDLL